MMTLSSLSTLYQTLTNDTSSSNVTQGLVFLNQSYRQICAERPWYWLEGTNTTVTVADQQPYALPYDYDKLIDMYVTVGSYKYVPVEIVAQDAWDRLNQQATYESNYPIYFHIYNNQLNLWPIPSTNGYVITYNYRKNVIDLSIANYTTGTVATVGTTTVTGSGTSWNASMIGKYLQITPTAVAATNGNGFWYKITAVASTTSLTLDKAYTSSNVTGATYIIGEVPAIVEPFQDMPAYKAAQMYYLTRNPDPQRFANYKLIYDEKYAGLVADSKKSTQTRIQVDANPYATVENPNLFWRS